jgi:hypothetical protein
MCRYVLIAVIVGLIVLMAVAALVVSLYGWTGFFALLLAFAFLGVVFRIAAPRLIPKLLMGTITRPMRQMGKVLRGATLTVHSVTPAEPPVNDDDEDEDEDERQRLRYSHRDDADHYEEDDYDDDADAGSNPADLDWYWIDFTVAPRDAESSEGRMVHRTAWNPGMLSFQLTKEDRPPQPVGMPAYFDQLASAEVLMNELEPWDGTEVEEPIDDMFGPARLRARVGVGRKIGTVLLVYAHFTEVGEIRIPRIDATPGRES